jgi:hypothetical protein
MTAHRSSRSVAASQQQRNKERDNHRDVSGRYTLKNRDKVRFVKSGPLLLLSGQRTTRDEIILKAPPVLTSSRTPQKLILQMLEGMYEAGLPLIPGVKPCFTVKIRALKNESPNQPPCMFEVFLEHHCRCKDIITTDCCVAICCKGGEPPQASNVNRTAGARAAFYYLEGSFRRNPMSFRELGVLVWLSGLRDADVGLNPAQRHRLEELEQKKLLGLTTFFQA